MSASRSLLVYAAPLTPVAGRRVAQPAVDDRRRRPAGSGPRRAKGWRRFWPVSLTTRSALAAGLKSTPKYVPFQRHVQVPHPGGLGVPRVEQVDPAGVPHAVQLPVLHPVVDAPPPPRPGDGPRPGAATHAGPTVAVTTVATLLAVAAGVVRGPDRRARLRGRPRRSGVHRLEQRLAGRRPGPRRRTSRQARRAGGGRAATAAHRGARAPAAAVVLSLLLGVVPGLLLLVLVASGWAYNAGLKRTAASVVPYVTGFGALPAGVVAAAPGTPDGTVVAGRRRGRAGGGGPPGQRRARPRGRPRHGGARPAAPPRCRVPSAVIGAVCCSAAPRSCWSWARTGRRRPPAGPGWSSPSPRSSSPPWPAAPASGGWPSPPSCC